MTIQQIMFVTLILGSFCNVLLPEANYEKVEPKLKRSRKIRVDNDFKKKVAHFTARSSEKNTESFFAAHEKDGANNSRHGYPQLPTDVCNCDKVEKYTQDYQDAIDRDLNYDMSVFPLNAGDTWPFYRADQLEKGLKFRLYQIKKEQKKCPQYQDKKFVKELMKTLEQ